MDMMNHSPLGYAARADRRIKLLDNRGAVSRQPPAIPARRRVAIPAYIVNLRRTTPARPIKPEPSSRMLEGSGVVEKNAVLAPPLVVRIENHSDPAPPGAVWARTMLKL